MTTVIVTPTHVAHDHCVVSMEIPLTTSVDMTHRKIFIPPNKKFYLGIAGIYAADRVDRPEVYEAIELIADHVRHEFKKGNKAAIKLPKDLRELTLGLKDFFDPIGCMVVGTDFRFKISPSKKTSDIFGTCINDHYGAGTGGMFAVGLLLGGSKLEEEEFWTTLHSFDVMSSVAHTIHAIADLEDWDGPVEEDADLPGEDA